MTILVIADPIIPVPPIGYGGTERILAVLCEGLKHRGHNVRLLAAAGSRDYGGGVVAYGAAGLSKLDRGVNKLGFQFKSLHALDGADVVINAGRLDYLHAIRFTSCPLLAWFHNPISQREIDYLDRIRPYRKCIVSVSEDQVRHLSLRSPNRVIYNAVETSYFVPVERPKRDYAVYLGRITSNKGLHLAIDVARRAGVWLKIAGNVPSEKGEQGYFDNVIKPQLGFGCEYIGEVNDEQKLALLQDARALIFPIKWNEPFGIVMAESMSCGVPVIALRRGSVPEVVRHGKNGFICNQVDEMVEALQNIDQVSRKSCRDDAVERFSAPQLIDHTLAAIELAKQNGPTGRSRPVLRTGARTALIIADPKLAVPPRLYGGSERIAAFLCQNLVERGWKVRLLAAPGSRDYGDGLWSHKLPSPVLVSRVYRKLIFQRISLEAAEGCDVVVNFGRLDYLQSLFRTEIPVVFRFGNPVSQAEIDYLSKRCARKSCSVFISRNQIRHLSGIGNHRVVYNGVDIDRFSPLDRPIAQRSYLLFLGRLTRNKGIDVAVAAAARTGMRLVIAGNLSDELEEQAFFKREIEPKLGLGCEWVGPVDDYQKRELLRQAKALLFPIRWEEPFGIVMAESLACGTPVIGMRIGSVPEVLEDGVTGFVCDDLDGICAAIAKLDGLSEKDCRIAAIQRFSAEPFMAGMLDAIQSAISS